MAQLGSTEGYRSASASKSVVQTQDLKTLFGEGVDSYARTGQSWRVVGDFVLLDHRGPGRRILIAEA